MLAKLSVFALLLIQFACASHTDYSPPPPSGKATQQTTPLRAGSNYTVRKGDTLYRIAKRSGLNYKRLAAANNIPSPYGIFPGQTIKLTEKTSKKRKTVKKKRKTTKRKAPSKKPIRNTGLKWHWPLKGIVKQNYAPKESGHKGIRIRGSAGDTVRAAAGGEVVYSGSGLVGYGELIIIKHNTKYLSAYGQTKKRLVKEGDVVKRGTAIAKLGSAAQRQHILHFEIRLNGQPLDPMRLLPRL